MSSKLILYYGLPVTAIAFFAGVLLLAHRSALAGAGTALCGAAITAEGVGLAVNWREGTSAFVAMLRRDQTNLLVYNYPRWGVRVGGAVIAVIGCILIGAGIGHLIR